jgi:tetratricopeptide (TPR) repeat protein
MRRCWGWTRNLRRCARIGKWWLFCGDHRRQPLTWIVFLVFTVGAGLASYYSALFGRALLSGRVGTRSHVHDKAPITVEPQELVKEAKILYNAHQPDLAIEKLNTALRLAPTLAPAHSLLATIYLFERHDSDACFKHICPAIQNSAQDWDVRATSLTLLGTLNRRRGQFDKALSLFQTVLNIYKDHNDLRGLIASYNNIGLVYQHLNNYPDALHSLNLARDMSDSLGDAVARARARMMLGSYYFGLKPAQYDEALHQWKLGGDIIAGKSPDEEAQFFQKIGAVYFELRQFDKALTAFRNSLRIATAPLSIADAHNGLGNVFRAQSKWAEALDEYKKALPLFERDSGRVGLYSSGNQRNPVIIQRDDLSLLARMREVSIRLKDYKKATEYCEEELRLLPGSPNAYYDQACIYCLMGNKEMALETLQKIKVDRHFAGMAETDTDLKCLWDNNVFRDLVRRGKATKAEVTIPGTSPPLSCER